MLITIVTPAYNESDNIPLMYDRIAAGLDSEDFSWEWIIVDDHSSDQTFKIAADLSENDDRVRAVRFSRNYGSHTALRCGFEAAYGDCVVGMAADLQDPPGLIPEMVEQWQGGAKVVWAEREVRLGEKGLPLVFSRLYYRIMRDMVGISQMPPEGADFFLIDRKVVDALNQFKERNVSIFALISWMGFSQTVIQYDKQARQHGKSGWSFEKKLKMAIDSMTSFSYKPIQLMTLIGMLLAAFSFVYLIVVLVNYFRGIAPQGWTSLMAAILLIGGLQIVMIGVLGEYIWRSLDESRQRPMYTIEDSTDIDKQGK